MKCFVVGMVKIAVKFLNALLELAALSKPCGLNV